MAVEIIMPKVDMVMETGTFVEWLKQEGETVLKGEALFVIQTDKAAIEIESPESGKLAGIAARTDDVIPVSSVIGYILQPGENLPEIVGVSQAATGQVNRAGADRTSVPDPIQQTTNYGIRATPLARNRAQELELDLAKIQGSGPRGRIYRADVDRHFQSTQSNARVEVVPSEPIHPATVTLPSARERKRVPLKGARKVIAERMAYSAQTIPHVHISLSIEMSECVRLREKVNPVYEKERGRGISFTAIIALAAARLLDKHPSLNSSLVNDEVIFWEDVNLGIATDLEELLVVPVVRSAQNKKLEQIAEEIDHLVEKARTRKLQPSEMSGSTFTISNLGMLGAESFTAIINPPETAILAVGRIMDTPVSIGREIVIRPMMNLTLAVDHRVTDGAKATRFLSDLKKILEDPYLLL